MNIKSGIYEGKSDFFFHLKNNNFTEVSRATIPAYYCKKESYGGNPLTTAQIKVVNNDRGRLGPPPPSLSDTPNWWRNGM